MKKIIGAIVGVIVGFFVLIITVFSFIRLVFDDTSSVQRSQYARKHYVDLHEVACEYGGMSDFLEIFMSIMIEESNDDQTSTDKLGAGYSGTDIKDGYRYAIDRFKTIYDYAQSIGVTDMYHVVQAYHFLYYKERQVIPVDESFCKDYLNWLVQRPDYGPTIRYSQTIASNYIAYATGRVYLTRRQMLIDEYINANHHLVEPEPEPYYDSNGNLVQSDWYSEDDLRMDAQIYADSIWHYGDIYYGRKDYALYIMMRTRYNYAYEIDIDLPALGSVDSADVVTLANAYLGRPYVSPSSPPTSFDCSSFTRYVYAQCGKSINSQAYTQYNQASKFYDVNLAHPGDLVFFQDTRSDGELRIADDGRNITHVGIYIGNNQFIHASSGKAEIVKSNLSNAFYSTHFASFGRF